MGQVSGTSLVLFASVWLTLNLYTSSQCLYGARQVFDSHALRLLCDSRTLLYNQAFWRALMSDDTDLPSFKFTGEIISIRLSGSGGSGGKRPLTASAGVYSAVGNIERLPGHDSSKGNPEKFLRLKIYEKQFITLDALNERLNTSQRRRGDYDELKISVTAKPIELWYSHGTLCSIPSTLIPTRKAYNDGVQLSIWENIANSLMGSPPTNTNPAYARFVLKAKTEKVKNEIKVYFSPSDVPVGGLGYAALEKFIADNKIKERFLADWPHIEVIEYKTAKELGLKEVGRHFLQLYCTWMSAAHYQMLWTEFNGISALPFKYPAEDTKAPKEYVKIDGKLKKGTQLLDGREIVITSAKMESARGMRSGEGSKTDTVRGISATLVANDLWKGFPATRMGQWIAEWLHRSAYAFGGLNEQVSLTTSDDANNLVFGSWECNTHMIRAENIITEITKRDAGMRGEGYKGVLTTTNIVSGEVDRMELTKTNSKAKIPDWVATSKYSWLSLSLKYRYQMKSSPLGFDIASEIVFDPWSLYVPLHIEPRLDDLLLRHVRTTRTTPPVKPLSGISLRSIKRSIVAMPTNPLRALPLLGLGSETNSVRAWQAATHGLPSLELPGLIIEHPTIAQPPPLPHRSKRSPVSTPAPAPVPETPTQDGFVLQGQVFLFGTSLMGNLEKWIGPSPADEVTGTDDPLIERVTLSEDFHLSTLIPLLRGTSYDVITFRNVAFYYQNYAFDKTKKIGWHFNADWVIDYSSRVLHQILTQVLGVDHSVLSIHAWLGEQQRWTTPLSLHSFILEGIFPNLTFTPVSGLQLTSIGVQLLGVRGFSLAPEPHSTLSFGFGIFGGMKLKVPGSIVPLDLNYEIGVVGNTVNLSAEISSRVWEDALGVRDLMLENVLFATTFSATSPWRSFAFDISAVFSYMGSHAYLQGSYASGGHFALTTQLDDFGLDEINHLFISLFSDTLTLPECDIHIGSASLSVVSGQGLSISLREVMIAGYTAPEVLLSFSSSGASLSGALSGNIIRFDDVELRDAMFQLAFWSSGKGKKADIMLTGTLGVEFLDLSVSAAVHLYPGDHGVEWAIVAALRAPEKPFSISNVVPEIGDTFLDFSLRNAVFIAASNDDLLIGQAYAEYHIRQGVQVFGLIDRIPALNNLLRQDISGLVLSAGWSKASGFNLAITLPTEASLDLGNGIKTTPISLAIRTNPVELAVTAGVTVPVKDSTPLDFNFVLAANLVDARASAEMKGWWVKPFGVDNLKIGPVITLSIEIVYAQFLTTGTPSGFGVSGGLMVGNTKAFLAMNISEDPTRQLMYGEVKKLDISDVVLFAGELIQQDIPKVPDHLLRFEELQIYVCPFGVVLGTVSYPQGFSFKADLLFFGKRANIECTIDKVQRMVDIIGGVDNFELGPLSIHGSKGPRAEVNCNIGVSKQQLVIDGVVKLFDMQAQTYVDIQFLPEPIFKFYLMLQFARIFMFKLDAELIGSINTNPGDADFSLYAELENDILEYIAQQVMEQLEAAKAAATEGLEAAQAKVEEAQRSWEAAIREAEKKVDAAKQEWEAYERSVRSESQPIIDNYLSEISRLQSDVENARRTYNNAMEDAERAVEQANRDRGVALAAAKRDVGYAKRDMDRAIDEAQRHLNYVEADLSQAFGDAQRAIDSAQREVWSLGNQINDVKNTIYEYEHAAWYEFWKFAAIPGLWVTVGTLEAAKGVASGALDAARGILQGASYLSKAAAVDTARVALELARSTGQASLDTAQGALTAADSTSKFAVDRANDVLEGVQIGADLVTLQGAIEGLEAFKSLNKAAYEVAVAAIQGLMESAKFIAFNAAKAGLEVARESTQVLDAAKEALYLVEKATKAALSILEEIVKFGAHAVNITYISLSGTLRGFLGVGGQAGRPLSAVIKGYLVGNWFEIRAEFDLREPVAFITAIFKQLWDMLSKDLGLHVRATPAAQESHQRVLVRSTRDLAAVEPGWVARSKFLGEQPRVLTLLHTASQSTSVKTLRGPFSGVPILPPRVLAAKAFFLMQKERGISVFEDSSDV